jgi:hypothetical protein
MRINDSYAMEFTAKYKRISSIIKHSQSIGNYHENIVRSFLSSFLSNRYSVKTGFIYDGINERVSRQIDIIVIDESIPSAYYFKENDFAIVDKKAVVCGIEVKSTFTKENYLDYLNKNIDYYSFCPNYSFYGFFFESRTKEMPQLLEKWYNSFSIPDKIENYGSAIFILNKGFIKFAPPNFASMWGHYFTINQYETDDIESIVVSTFLAGIQKDCEIRLGIKNNPFAQYADYHFWNINKCYRFGKTYNGEHILSDIK